MRLETDEKVWFVTDPEPESVLADIYFEASLRTLERMFRGGMTCDENPVLFTDAEEAKAEAEKRLLARDAAVAIVRDVEGGEGLEDVDQIQLLDRKGRVTLSLRIARNR